MGPVAPSRGWEWSAERRLKELDAREERLLDLAEDGELPQARLKTRLRKLATERQRVLSEKADTDRQLAVGADVVIAATQALSNIQAVYRDAPDEARGFIAKALFEAIHIDEDSIDADLNEPFASLSAATALTGEAANAKRPDLMVEALRPNVGPEPGGDTSHVGSNTALLAEEGRFELPLQVSPD